MNGVIRLNRYEQTMNIRAPALINIIWAENDPDLLFHNGSKDSFTRSIGGAQVKNPQKIHINHHAQKRKP